MSDPKAVLETTDDFSGVRNDSGLPPEVALARLRRTGVTLHYGDLAVIVEQHAIDEAEKAIAGASPEDRRIGMWKISKALNRAAPKIAKGKFSREVANKFYSDLCLWHILRRTAN